MGFFREAREFMQVVRDWQADQSSKGDMIDILVRQNRELMDRLMASNFEEFRIYDRDGKDVLKDSSSEYNPESDVDNAGEVIEFDEMAYSSRQ